MKNRSIYFELWLVYLAFLLFATFYRGPGMNTSLEKVLSVATFLFAINLGFSIANRKQRLNSVRSFLRKNDAIILSIYEASKMYGKEVTDKIRTLIDNMLIKQIDYKLSDFDRTTPELVELFRFSAKPLPKDSDIEGRRMMMAGSKELILSQKEVIYWIKDGMMLFEWISLLILCAIIILCIFSMNDGSFLMIAVLPLLSTAIILLLYVLRDIDNLSWQEENWIWNRLIDLFEELDLPPYLVAALFRKNRLSKKRLNMPKQYRLVEYPFKYPNITDKKVRLVHDE